MLGWATHPATGSQGQGTAVFAGESSAASWALGAAEIMSWTKSDSESEEAADWLRSQEHQGGERQLG